LQAFPALQLGFVVDLDRRNVVAAQAPQKYASTLQLPRPVDGRGKLHPVFGRRLFHFRRFRTTKKNSGSTTAAAA
jgi:hypothetical protein